VLCSEKIAMEMQVKHRILMALLGAWLLAAPASAQEKVAEGEYHLRTGAAGESSSTVIDHWILSTRKQGGYRLEAEVTSAAGTGVIVIQTEDLNEQLNPTAITVKLYTKENTKKPFSQLACHLDAEQITCKSGGLDLNVNSETTKKGPILFAVTNLEHIDLAWMMAAAINRAHLDEGTVQVPTLVLQDGEEAPELAQTEVDTLRVGDKETVEMRGVKIPARRYSFENSRIKCWIADSGLLLKMENEDGSVVELTKFKQYKKLVPELP
jgi:hypothetical protein